MNAFAQRRGRALADFEGGVAVIPSARVARRNNDNNFPFRQNSDFYYLTGFDEPDSVLVLVAHGDAKRSVLFLRERDRAKELWDGRRLGIEGARDRLGVDEAFAIGELSARLPELLAGASSLHYLFGDDAENDRTVHEALQGARSKTRSKGTSPQTFVDPALVLHEMRLIKSDDEIETMRRCALITRIGFEAAMAGTRPGRFEYEIASEIENLYRANGAQDVAYPSIVASGDNATVLHYVTNRDRLQAGGLLLIDSGAELDYYASDVTRTWPIDGRFTPEQRAIYEIVLSAQQAAMECVRPGIPRNRFHDAAVRRIVEGLIDVGLLEGSVDENVASEKFKEYYPHGTGHWLGLDVHDAGATRDAQDKPVLLSPGMVTTVEPGIYVRRDAPCGDRFKGIGVRIEDDLLVTASGHENLTAAIPKKVDDLERSVGSAHAAAR